MSFHEIDTDIENILMVAKQKVVCVRGTDHELGVSNHKLFHIGWINSKALLYSTGNHFKCLVIKHNGKVFFKYIYINESLC